MAFFALSLNVAVPIPQISYVHTAIKIGRRPDV